MYGDIAGKIADIICYSKEIMEIMTDLKKDGIEFCNISIADDVKPRLHVYHGLRKIAEDMQKKEKLEINKIDNMEFRSYIVPHDEAEIFQCFECAQEEAEDDEE